jgi:hypothetical protein
MDFLFDGQKFADYQSIIQLSVGTNSALVGLFLIFDEERRSALKRVDQLEATASEGESKLGKNDVDVMSLRGVLDVVKETLKEEPDQERRWTKYIAVLFALISVPILWASSAFAEKEIYRIWGLFYLLLLVPICVAIVRAILTGIAVFQSDAGPITSARIAARTILKKIADQGPLPAA